MLIYKVTHTPSGRVYVGQTQGDLHNRILEHFQEAFAGSRTKFHNAIRKYGKEAFRAEIIEDNISDIVTLNAREIYWISFYDSYQNGFNSTIGGDNSPMHSALVREHFLATVQSAEYRKRKSAIMKKNVKDRGGFSQEHRKHLSESMIGNRHFAGHHLSEQHIDALRASHFKPVIGIDNLGVEHRFKCVQSAVVWWMSHGAPQWKDWKCSGSEQIKRSIERNVAIHGVLWKAV